MRREVRASPLGDSSVHITPQGSDAVLERASVTVHTMTRPILRLPSMSEYRLHERLIAVGTPRTQAPIAVLRRPSTRILGKRVSRETGGPHEGAGES